MRSSESQAALAPALVRAINAIEGVKKNGTGNFGKHATLEGCINAAHEHLDANGLAVMQGPGPMQGDALTVTTRIIHESGEWVETDFTIPLAKKDPQSAGSAVTYARRYSLMAMLNMPAVDDDGEAAMVRPPAQQPRKDSGPGPVDGKDFYGVTGKGMSANEAKAKKLDLVFDTMRQEIAVLPTTAALREWIEKNREDVAPMPFAWRSMLRDECDERATDLGFNPEQRAA